VSTRLLPTIGAGNTKPAAYTDVRLPAMESPGSVVLVEGISDKVALESVARRRGRDLAGAGVRVVPLGGAQALGRFLNLYSPTRADIRLAGLCDAGEEGSFRRALGRAGFGLDLSRTDMERLGFFVCEADLEDELVRSLGAPVVEEILDAHGKLKSFRTYQKQPAHRARTTEEQLRGFLNNWKIELAKPLVEALDLGRVPRPLDGVLLHV
jgi:OLD-like protein